MSRYHVALCACLWGCSSAFATEITLSYDPAPFIAGIQSIEIEYAQTPDKAFVFATSSDQPTGCVEPALCFGQFEFHAELPHLERIDYNVHAGMEDQVLSFFIVALNESPLVVTVSAVHTISFGKIMPTAPEIWLDPMTFTAHLYPDGAIYPQTALFDPGPLEDWAVTRSYARTYGTAQVGLSNVDGAGLTKIVSALAQDELGFFIVNGGPGATYCGSEVPVSQIGEQGAEHGFFKGPSALKQVYDHGGKIDTIVMDGVMAILIGGKSAKCTLSIEQAAREVVDYMIETRDIAAQYQQLIGQPAETPIRFAWNINLASWLYSLADGVTTGAIDANPGYGLGSDGFNDPAFPPVDARDVVVALVSEVEARGEQLLFIAHETPVGAFLNGTISGDGIKGSLDAGLKFQQREVDFRQLLEQLGVAAGRYYTPYVQTEPVHGSNSDACLWQQDPACSYSWNAKFRSDLFAHLIVQEQMFNDAGLPPHYDYVILSAFDQDVPTVNLPELPVSPGSNPYTFFDTARQVSEIVLGLDQ